MSKALAQMQPLAAAQSSKLAQQKEATMTELRRQLVAEIRQMTARTQQELPAAAGQKATSKGVAATTNIIPVVLQSSEKQKLRDLQTRHRDTFQALVADTKRQQAQKQKESAETQGVFSAENFGAPPPDYTEERLTQLERFAAMLRGIPDADVRTITARVVEGTFTDD